MDGNIGRVLLNRPSVLNALNLTFVVELERAMCELENQVRVILIEGAGKHFCAGADLDYLSKASDTGWITERGIGSGPRPCP